MANPSYYKSILAQVQEATADALNEDAVLSGRVNFIPENAKDIEYQIKEAMGKQGIVGIIMTPECQYQGTNGKELVWDLRDFTVQIVENPIVNRSNPNPDLTITALDSAIRAADVLGSPSFDLFGIYNPASIEQGEDSGLLVAQARFNCQVRQDRKDPYTYIYFADGTTKKFLWEGEVTSQMAHDTGLSDTSPSARIVFGTVVSSIADESFVGLPVTEASFNSGLLSIGRRAFAFNGILTNIELPDTVQSIAEEAFVEDPNIEVTFQGKTKAEVQAMENYPWGIENTQNIHNIIGPNTRVKYGWSQSWDSLPLSGTLNSDDLPSRDGIRYIGIGSSIDEIGYRAFGGIEFLTGVEIPTTVTAIGALAFSGAESMTDIEIPSSVSSIGSDAFLGCHMLSSVTFDGKTIEQVQAMTNYSWGLYSGCVIHCSDGDITL